jgi:hypothetical protein
MNQEQQVKVRQLIEVLDHALSSAGCEVLDALNAVSVMSTSLAHSMNLPKDEYMGNLEMMFDMTNPQKQMENGDGLELESN